VDGALGEADLVQVDDLQLHILRLLYVSDRLSFLFVYFVFIGWWSGLIDPNLFDAYLVLVEESAESNRCNNLFRKS
jgi:hypothetical protein